MPNLTASVGNVYLSKLLASNLFVNLFTNHWQIITHIQILSIPEKKLENIAINKHGRTFQKYEYSTF